MLIEHISISRTKLWQECQQQYKFKYHLQIPSPEPEPEHFYYGKVVHKIIEVHTKDKGKTHINDIVKNVLNGTISIDQEKKELSPEYKKKLPVHLHQYLRLCEKIGYDGFVEWEFKYDLDPPNNRLAYGFIDRLIEKDGKVFVFDWKTTQKSSWRTNARTVSGDLQLQAYCRIVQKTFNIEADKISAALYFLDGGELVGSSFSQKTLDDVEKKLLDVYKEIQNMDPDQVWGHVGPWCKRCPWRKQCPFYSLL